jgi:hypothetical protein
MNYLREVFFCKSKIVNMSSLVLVNKIFRYLFSVLKLFAGIILLMSLCSGKPGNSEKGYRIINPYENFKPFPYKATLHNHSAFHFEYTHAKEPPAKRLKDYRDFDTNPPYGIIGISDHERITTPWNTVPSGNVQGNDYPWGVGGILWIPGNESNIGNQSTGGVFGDMVIVNVSTEITDEIDWEISQDSLSESGWLYISKSKEVPVSIELSFSGTGFRWIARKEPCGGIVSVFVDGKKTGEADLFSDDFSYNQEVFSLKGLENEEHFLQLVYERKGSSNERYMGIVNMDMIVVTKADGSQVKYGAQHQSLNYHPKVYKHAAHPRGEGRGVEEAFKSLGNDGCFLVLAHPNARLETEGEHKGTQLWSSAGYTYAELDSIFGNVEKGIPPLSYLPHAMEIGNKGYDFSLRTNFTNAEEKWDYVLKQGIRVMGTASDDTHGLVKPGGWVVVNTNAKYRRELTIPDVMECLFSGNYYSSQGPVMKISVDKKSFIIETDVPSLIEFISQGKVIYSEKNSSSATYKIKGNEEYVRGRVTQTNEKWEEIEKGIGKKRSAWTNPVYIISE